MQNSITSRKSEMSGLAKTCPGGHTRAHMGPNPDRAQTRTGPQPGPGPLSKLAAHMSSLGPDNLTSSPDTCRPHLTLKLQAKWLPPGSDILASR